MEIIYLIQRKDGCVKIGTTIHLRRRYTQLCKQQKDALKILAFAPGGEQEERDLHGRFQGFRIHTERNVPTDWFLPAPIIFDWFKDYGKPFVGFRLSASNKHEWNSDVAGINLKAEISERYYDFKGFHNFELSEAARMRQSEYERSGIILECDLLL